MSAKTVAFVGAALLLLPVTVRGTEQERRPSPRMGFIVAEAAPHG